VKYDWAVKLGVVSGISWTVEQGIEEMGQYMQEGDENVAGNFPLTQVDVANKVVLIQHTESAGTLRDMLGDWLLDHRNEVGEGWKLRIVKELSSEKRQRRHRGAKTAATQEDLIPGMEKLGWSPTSSGNKHWQTFRKGDTVVHVQFLGESNGSPVVHTWQAYGEVDPETTSLLDGMT
jgi:hypothetical protein